VIFFFDRNLGVRLARMLNQFDVNHTIRHLDDDGRFDQRTQDVELVETLASENPKPVFLTADTKMRKKNPEERRALAQSGLTVVFFRKRWHDLSFNDQAWKLLRIWPRVVKETEICRRPTTFEITPRANKVQWIGFTEDL